MSTENPTLIAPRVLVELDFIYWFLIDVVGATAAQQGKKGHPEPAQGATVGGLTPYIAYLVMENICTLHSPTEDFTDACKLTDIKAMGGVHNLRECTVTCICGRVMEKPPEYGCNRCEEAISTSMYSCYYDRCNEPHCPIGGCERLLVPMPDNEWLSCKCPRHIAV